MKDLDTLDLYGEVSEPATLTIQRLLPGPIERVWAYLTESDLRREWLASGEMTLEVGAPFELVWRNDELTDPPGTRPADIACEQRMESRLTELDPPRRIAFAWSGSGEVSIDLEPRGDRVLMTVVHRRLPDRPTLVGVSAGWHGHCDILAARLEGVAPRPVWDRWTQLRAEYDSRLPG